MTGEAQPAPRPPYATGRHAISLSQRSHVTASWKKLRLLGLTLPGRGDAFRSLDSGQRKRVNIQMKFCDSYNISWICDIVKRASSLDHPQDFMVSNRAMWDLSRMWTLMRLQGGQGSPPGSYKLPLHAAAGPFHTTLRPNQGGKTTRSPWWQGSTLLPAPSPLGYFGHDHTMYQFTLPHLETQSSGKNSLFRCGREFGHSL